MPTVRSESRATLERTRNVAQLRTDSSGAVRNPLVIVPKMKGSSASTNVQACAVPYRFYGGRLEVCLVTSMKSRRWIFPKGFVELDETEPEAALKEAWEEAGLRGQIVGDRLGTYVRRKVRAQLRVCGYLMQVDEASRRWKESHLRRRCWVSIADAYAQLHLEEQRDLLTMAVRMLELSRSQAS